MSQPSKRAFLFPGQGSQYIGMGEEFFKAFPQASDIFKKAESATEIPISELCFKGPADELVKTSNLQPCLTAVEIVCASAAISKGYSPDAVAGHSLGEYPALWCAGIVDVETALRLVLHRGRLMDKAAEENPGAMAAVIGVTREKLEKMVEDCRQDGEVLALANHNSPEQIVVTGHKEAVGRLCGAVKEMKKRAVPLKVSGGYHSPLMKQAADSFSKILKDVKFSPPTLPFYSNVTGKAESDPDRIKELMVEQICAPVRWVDIVNSMADDGICCYVEAGPKKVLTNLTGKCLSDRSGITYCQFDTPDTLEECMKCD